MISSVGAVGYQCHVTQYIIVAPIIEGGLGTHCEL